MFDSLATMTLVLGAKSGGDLTKAGFTPQELSNFATASHRAPRLLERAESFQGRGRE